MAPSGRQEVRHGDPIHHRAVILEQLPHSVVFLGLQVNAEMRAELATMKHDALTIRLPDVVVAGERCVDILVLAQKARERLSIAGGFCNAETHMLAR